MRKSAIVEKVTKEQMITDINCDICNRRISGKFWRLTTSHRDWGNDSCDSIRKYDICSRDCIDKMLTNYMKECINSYTQEFDLEQDYFKEDL